MITILSVALWTPASCRAPLQAALAPLATQLRPQFHPEEDSARDLPAALASDARLPCVVVWAGLEAHLAEHLAGQGADAGDAEVVAGALAAWAERAEALLAAFGRARRRVTLVPAAAVLAAPAGVAAALAARLGLAVSDLAPNLAPDLSAPAAVLPQDLPAHAALMAAAVLQTAPAARALQDRLEAASLPVAGFSLARAQGAAGIAAVLAVQDRREGGRLDALRAERDAERSRAETARALIAEALAAQTDMTARLVQAEAEARAEARSAAARLTELAGTHAETEAALARAETAAQEAADTARRLQERLLQGEAERAALEAQIATLEAGQAGTLAELRARVSEIAALTEEARQRAALIARQRSELQTEAARRAEVEALRDALLTSTSWRITAPLRRVVMALRRMRGA